MHNASSPQFSMKTWSLTYTNNTLKFGLALFERNVFWGQLEIFASFLSHNLFKFFYVPPIPLIHFRNMEWFCGNYKLPIHFHNFWTQYGFTLEQWFCNNVESYLLERAEGKRIGFLELSEKDLADIINNFDDQKKFYDCMLTEFKGEDK